MQTVFTPLEELQGFIELRDFLDKGETPVQVTGCMDSQKSHLMAALSKEKLFKVVVVEDELKAKEV